MLEAGGRIKAGGLAVSEPKFCEKIFTQILSIYFQIFRYLFKYNELNKKLLT